MLLELVKENDYLLRFECMMIVDYDNYYWRFASLNWIDYDYYGLQNMWYILISNRNYI